MKQHETIEETMFSLRFVIYKIDLFQYKSQFHYVLNVNPGNQGSRYFF
jgi:hypothetical protein